MNTYIAFYKRLKLEVKATNSYEAQKLAADLFRTKKTMNVTVSLVETNGKPVTTTITN